MLTYLSRHLQVLFATLGDMRRTPMATFNTLMIVAITLLLPSLLYVSVKSAQNLNGNWQGRPQISIFLQKDLNEREAKLIFEEIRLHPNVELAELVSPEQALEEFRILAEQDTKSEAADASVGDAQQNSVNTAGESNNKTSSFDAELAFLGENPLPASIVVMPNDASIQSADLSQLKNQLGKIDGIESIRLDLSWIDRFNAILNVGSRIALLLSGLLAIALILIVGNTIKLLIINRRHEIEITKLVGGTNSFVRRPFLYYGTLFGLFGALITLGLLLLASSLVDQPLSHLASLYQSKALVHRLTAGEIALLLLIGSTLGWLAARWSVAQHLRHIQPR